MFVQPKASSPRPWRRGVASAVWSAAAGRVRTQRVGRRPAVRPTLGEVGRWEGADYLRLPQGGPYVVVAGQAFVGDVEAFQASNRIAQPRCLLRVAAALPCFRDVSGLAGQQWNIVCHW